MSFRSDLQFWLAILGTSVVAILFCYAFVDRPVAEFVHAHLQQKAIFDSATHLPDPFVPLALIALLYCGLRKLAGGQIAGHLESAMLCAFSMVWASGFKSALKLLIGRTWPETWIQNNPSYIGTHDYGFHPFHSGPAYQSFPSGHMALTTAIAWVVWIRYPRFRPLCLAAMAIVASGLVGMNYHFLSDVIGGWFVGFTTAWLTLRLWGEAS